MRYWDSSGTLRSRTLQYSGHYVQHSELHYIGLFKRAGYTSSLYLTGLFYKISFRNDYYDSAGVSTKQTFMSDKINSYSLNFDFFDPDRNVYEDDKVQK